MLFVIMFYTDKLNFLKNNYEWKIPSIFASLISNYEIKALRLILHPVTNSLFFGESQPVSITVIRAIEVITLFLSKFVLSD